MKLVVGLGNPGRKYEATRHNIGFAVVEELARRYGMSGSFRRNFDGETAEASLRGVKSLLLCPHTYMNRSGSSVLAARDFYKLPHQDLLIVVDDINLPLAKLRFRKNGSAGGQKGLDDIIRRLGGDDIPRLRIGVGLLPAGWDAAGFVLGKFTKEEVPEIQQAVGRAAEAVVDWAVEGIDYCMNRYNA